MSRKEKGGWLQGVIQRKLDDGGNRTAGKFLKHLRGSLDWIKLPVTIFFQKVNIFTRRELIRIKI